jgi:cytochrome c
LCVPSHIGKLWFLTEKNNLIVIQKNAHMGAFVSTMKKAIISAMALCAIVLAVACGGDPKPAETAAPAAEAESNDVTKNPDYQKGLALVAKSDCLTCHKVAETLTGPAYAEVAAKYAGADDATIEKLANTIIKGGSGNWGQIQMTPHPTLSLDDAKQMVKYVLLLKK